MAPASAVPPSLPPSVEEAYRRKCIQLKERTKEVEEANDASRLRLARLKRQVEKMRIERAFLLEQLSRRTSANVEDSVGSPSPPPTPNPKPLRIKRGHRKPSLLSGAADDAQPSSPSRPAGGGGATSTSGKPGSKTKSEGAESPSPQATAKDSATKAAKNGTSRPSRKPTSAFALYAAETRPSLVEKLEKEDGDGADIDEELERSWKELSDSRRAHFESQYEKELARFQKDKDGQKGKGKGKRQSAAAAASSTAGDKDDEDVEMGNDDTEQETPGDKADE